MSGVFQEDALQKHFCGLRLQVLSDFKSLFRNGKVPPRG